MLRTSPICALLLLVACCGQAMARGPAFDCAKADGSIERMICDDAELATLDRTMASVYAAALRKAANERPPALKADQRGWIKGRNDCWKSNDRRQCVVELYRLRRIELQTRYRLVPVAGSATFLCDGDPRNEVVVNYFRTDPPSLIAERGDSASLMLQQPAASGTRYRGRNESLWEHQGEATVVWGYGAPEMRCHTGQDKKEGLAGTTWELVAIQSMDDAQSTRRIDRPERYTLDFADDGRASFRIDCKRGSAAWKATPSAAASSGSLEFSPLAITRAKCAPGSADRKVMRDLPYVRSYLLKDGELFLSLMADGGIYEWRPSARTGSVRADAPVLGYSPRNMDRKVDPRRDFYRYAAGNWLRQTEIPASDPDIGGFSQLAHNLNDQLLKLIREAADMPADRRDPLQQQVGDFYRAAMDTQRLDALGLQPLADDLKAIDQADSPEAFGKLAAQLQLGYSVSPLINAATGADQKQSTMNVLYLATGMRALNQDEYAKPDGQRIRELYADFIAKMFRTLGDTPEQARANAHTVIAIESELSAAELTPLQRYDPATTYNKLSLAEAQALVPAIDIKAFLGELGVTPPETVQVPDLAGLRATQKVMTSRPLTELRTLLRWHVLSARTSALGQPWYGLDQEFSRARQGLQVSEPREQEVTKAIGAMLFHPLSRLYVKAYFPESTRRDITQMVGHIKDEFEQRLRTNPWLDEPTRQAALEKLGKLEVAVGYPDQWIDFSSVEIRPDDHFGNVRRIGSFLQRRNLAQIGKPVVVERFAVPTKTTPISVNAAYSPQQNNVDITAAIVQPPFYQPGADAAVNYCTIGAVIGHELTHGFDSMGRQFGPAGNLRDWWTPQATAKFKQRTDVLVDQYGKFEIQPGLMHNGRQTLTENTADLGGITLAHAALQRHLAQNPLPNIDGLTSDQRCFVAWSQMWAYKARPERLRLLVSIDYHAIASVRAVAPLLHLDAFHRAFGTRPGDTMWRDTKRRVLIW